MSDCCDICGIGFYLPSRVCDHCDSKADDHPSTPRPIETAPRNQTELLLFSKRSGWHVGKSYQNEWLDKEDTYIFLDPTHWLPLPPAPL